MARLSSEVLKDSLWFTKELGQRLAGLRKGQGLTQQQLAVLMGRRGRGNWTLVSAMELGRMKTPSLRLVGDFLRACRASFDDLKDILNRYTAQRTAAEQAGLAAVGRLTRNLPVKTATEVLKYDVKKAAERRAKGDMPEKPARRQMRARKLARAALLREKLHLHVKGVIDTEHLDRNWQDAKQLFDHTRKVYGILNRTRGGSEEERQTLLDKARAWLVDQNVAPEASIDRVQQAVVDWYRRHELTGELDRLPPVSRHVRRRRRRRRKS